MPPTTILRLSTRSRWLTPFDASRSYLLDVDVDCNIPRRGYPASFGAHDWARGHLVELHRRLGGTPLSLHYRELLARHPCDEPTVPAHLPVGSEITAQLRDCHGHLVTVVSRTESAPYGPHGDAWQVSINDEVPHGGDNPYLDGAHHSPPSLPFLAYLVDRHLHTSTAAPPAWVIPLPTA